MTFPGAPTRATGLRTSQITSGDHSLTCHHHPFPCWVRLPPARKETPHYTQGPFPGPDSILYPDDPSTQRTEDSIAPSANRFLAAPAHRGPQPVGAGDGVWNQLPLNPGEVQGTIQRPLRKQPTAALHGSWPEITAPLASVLCPALLLN